MAIRTDLNGRTTASGMQSGQTPGSATVTLDGISMSFRIKRGETVTALSGVSTTIKKGEFVALIGPSGCGKSTMLRIIAGLQEPSEGTINIDGERPANLIKEHRLGMAFQEHALLPWATVRQSIALPYRLAKLPVDQSRIASLVDLVGLKGFENARPKQLSGGMRQRVSIARSLVLDPDLLLLDEPFGALDEITRRRLNFELARIWAETSVTTVMVTHSVDEALLLADRVIVMGTKPGRIVTEVPVDIPRPRDAESTLSPQFAALRAELVGLLDASESRAKP